MTTKINGRDIQLMVRHWLETPPNGYLGSDYGSDTKTLLQKPFSDTSYFDAFKTKLRKDVPVLRALPSSMTNIGHRGTYPDKLEIAIEVAGQTIEIGGSR